MLPQKMNCIIYVDGQKNSNVHIYFTTYPNNDGPWYFLGLTQNISTELNSESWLVKLNLSVLGLELIEIDKPDMSNGVILCIADYFKISNKHAPLAHNVSVYCGKAVGLHNAYLPDYEPCGGLHSVKLSANVDQENIDFEIVGYKNFTSNIFPSWVPYIEK